MSKLNFASDIDGCVLDLDTSLRKEFFDKYGITVNEKDVRVYNYEDFLDLPYEDVWVTITEVVERANLDIFENAQEIINETTNWHGANIPLFITSRKPERLDATTDNLRKYFTDFYPLHLNGNSKADIINQFEVNLFVEDCADTVLDIAVNTDCTVLLFDHPWNEEFDDKSFKQVERVDNWLEIKEYIDANFDD